jgi:vacuolar-type H+-ATPase subunit H
VNFEEAGRAVDREVAKLLEYLDREVKPATRQEMARLLHRASERLKKLADDLDKTDS